MSWSAPITCTGIDSEPSRSAASWRLDASSWRANASGGWGFGFASIILRRKSIAPGFSKYSSDSVRSRRSSMCSSREIFCRRPPQLRLSCRA
jgi:hypothetical protein